MCNLHFNKLNLQTKTSCKNYILPHIIQVEEVYVKKALKLFRYTLPKKEKPVPLNQVYLAIVSSLYCIKKNLGDNDLGIPQVFTLGKQSRATASTDINEHSSIQTPRTFAHTNRTC